MTSRHMALRKGQELLEKEDFELAFDVLLPLADAGVIEAEGTIGAMHMLGLGVSRDLEKAEKYLKRAAHKGNALAANNLSTLYMTCEPDWPLNPEEARKWFKVAIDLGFDPGARRV